MDELKSAVVVKDLYKSFKLPHEQHSGIKQTIVNIFDSKHGYETQEVLKDITFEIKKGEFFGIVGRNGSGKSTLLKLIAGIYVPDKGLVHVDGSLTPFIELGVGFNPELTGRENVFMNGALLGFDKKEMQLMYDDIVDFAEIADFMDQKLKNYSSGMQVRLAFSIAIRAKSDVLLIDEVLAVGDSAFQKKCFDYFQSLKDQNQTIILVTHDMSAVERFCSRALLIDKGKVLIEGDPYEVAAKYSILNQPQAKKKGTQDQSQKWGISAKVLSSQIKQGEDRILIETELNSSENNIIVSHSIIRVDNTYVAGFNTFKTLNIQKGDNQKIKSTFLLDQLLTGNYFINTSIYTNDFKLLDFKSGIASFRVNEKLKNIKDGIVNLSCEWDYDSKKA